MVRERVALVVFLLEEQLYAVPLAMVDRVWPMAAVTLLPQAPDVVLGVINIHGTIFPVVDLRRRFRRALREYGVRAHLLLVRTSRRRIVVPVDETLGVREVDLQAVSPPETVVPGAGYVAGMVTLSDGLLFIQDLDAVLSLDEDRRLTEALREPSE